jgi:ribosomal protein L30/L7E
MAVVKEAREQLLLLLGMRAINSCVTVQVQKF